MIFGTEVLPAGNAVRLHIRPPAGTTSCVLLRREDEDFVGPVDPGAVLLVSWDGEDFAVIMDTTNLVNGTPYFWRVYYAPSDTYETTSATPAAGYAGFGPDAVLVLMDRLRVGLAIEVGRGALHPKAGTIPVQKLATPMGPNPVPLAPTLRDFASTWTARRQWSATRPQICNSSRRWRRSSVFGAQYRTWWGLSGVNGIFPEYLRSLGRREQEETIGRTT